MDFELNREHKRVMIFYDYKRGLSQEECLANLISAFGDSFVSRATVFRWYAEFTRGRQSFEDDPRPGRPPTAVTPENISAVHDLVCIDPHVTYEMLEATLKIGSAAIHQIIHEYLGLRKLCSRWVPHRLTEAQKQERVDFCKRALAKFDRGRAKHVFDIITGDEAWFYYYDPLTKNQSRVWVSEGDPTPTKVRRTRSVGMKMFAIFFRKSGMVIRIPLEDHATVTAQWYCEVCLPQVFTELEKSRPSAGLRGLLLHHDNAPAHTAGRTVEFLAQSRMGTLPHSPYSPDLAPCDFWLFPKVKEPLRGRDFESEEELTAAIDEVLGSIPNSDFADCFNKWFELMQNALKLMVIILKK